MPAAAPTPTGVPAWNPEGELVTIPAFDAAAEMNGYRQATPQDVHEAQIQSEYGGAGSALGAAGEGALNALTFGAGTAALRGAGITTKEGEEGRAEAHPVWHGAGTIAGIAAPLILSGGLAAPAEGAALAGSGALATARAASRFTAPALIARAGRAAAGAAEGVGGTGLLGRALPALAAGATEGGLYAGSDVTEKALLGDPNLTWEKAASEVGLGALFGGALGAGGKTLSELLPANLGESMADKLGETGGIRNVKAASGPGGSQRLINSIQKQVGGKKNLATIGQEMGDLGLVGPLSTPEKTAALAQTLKESSGKEMGAILDAADATGAGAPAVKDLFGRAREEIFEPLADNPLEKSVAKKVGELFDDYEAKYTAATPSPIKDGDALMYLRKRLAGGAESASYPVRLGDNKYVLEFRPHSIEGDTVVSHYPEVTASTPDGVTVGTAKFVRRAPEGMEPPRLPDGQLDFSKFDLVGHDLNVDPDHGRRGLASAMYDFAERLTGQRILPDPIQSPAGAAFTGSRNATLGFRTLHDLRQEVDEKLYGLRGTQDPDGTAYKVALHDFRSLISDEIGSGIDNAGLSSDAWKAANRKYQVASVAGRLADSGMLKHSGNNLASLTEIMAGLTGAAAHGLPGGALAGLGMHFAREHASGILGWAATGAQRRLLLLSQRSNKALSAATSAIFSGARGEAAAGGASSTAERFSDGGLVTPEKFADVSSALHNYGDLDTLASDVAKQTSVLQEHAPGTASAAHAFAARVVSHLGSKLPQDTGPRQLLDPPFAPSHPELATYNKHHEIAQRGPVAVLEHLARGTLAPEHMEASQAIYPRLHAEAAQLVAEKMAEHIAAKKTIPARLRPGLALFMGADLEHATTPQAILSAQMAYQSAPSGPPPGQGKQPGRTRNVETHASERAAPPSQQGSASLQKA